ncbi:transposase [uncultured Muribaculum sp.]|uniref:ISAon1 family transposase n=1 Tax=uncultured Muribaculum sp. TaxID=1918613 RepID=UPI0025AE05ED|nr:transposase [uncultured Muribaculum sp.]
METTALSIKHIAQMYCVNGKYFAEQYRNRISGYTEWREAELGCGFYFNANNIGPYMSLDETCLSNGEVWTFLTNKDGHGGRGTLAAAIPGTKSDEITTILIGAMGKSVRRRVKEVTCDLSPSMMLIAAEVFYNAHVVNDRFHVQQVYNEAVDEIRIDIRRQLIAEDNSRDKSEPPITYSNGETMRQILARSKHTLMMSQNKWTDIQRHRANILFRHYPILKAAYHLAMELRQIFNAKISPTKAMGRMNKWYEKVMALGNNNFRSVIKTFKNHAPTILNYFRRRATNASAEVFNSKVKIFRSQMRGVRDRDFFIFRLVKLYA